MNPCSENFNTDEDVSADGRFVIHMFPEVRTGWNKFQASGINNQVLSFKTFRGVIICVSNYDYDIQMLICLTISYITIIICLF